MNKAVVIIGANLAVAALLLLIVSNGVPSAGMGLLAQAIVAFVMAISEFFGSKDKKNGWAWMLSMLLILLIGIPMCVGISLSEAKKG